MMHKRTCPECGAAFTPHYNQQVCCSDECKKVRRRRLDHDRDQMREHKILRHQRESRKEKTRRRAEFFAARDAAFERAGLPIPKIEVRDGVRIERRGHGFGSIH